MIIFEPVEEFEWYAGDQLMAVYQPGLSYTCRDEDTKLAKELPKWIEQGIVKVIEDSKGTGPSQIVARGTIH